MRGIANSIAIGALVAGLACGGSQPPPEPIETEPSGDGATEPGGDGATVPAHDKALDGPSPSPDPKLIEMLDELIAACSLGTVEESIIAAAPFFVDGSDGHVDNTCETLLSELTFRSVGNHVERYTVEVDASGEVHVLHFYAEDDYGARTVIARLLTHGASYKFLDARAEYEDPPPAVQESIGTGDANIECWEPYDKYVKCINDTFPETGREAALDGMQQMRDGLEESLKTEDGKNAALANCVRIAEVWEKSAKGLGCAW